MTFSPVRPRERFLVFGAPDLQQDEIDEVVCCMKTGWIGTGPRVARFEKEFARYKTAAHAVAVNSGTAALHLSMLAADLEPGDEVVTSALTFCATVNAIIHAGLRPVLADIDPLTMNLNPADVAARITRRTRAILPVHFAGRCCNMDALTELAERHGLSMIEDCAHAIETEYKGRKAGTFGQFGCFSFYVTKNVVTGEGGMILTESEDTAARIKMLALHGLSKDAWSRFSDQGYKHYEVVASGFKYNMMDLQAAIGIHQLARVEENWNRRRRLWNRYNELLHALPLRLPAPEEPDTRHAYHLYTVLVDQDAAGISRDDFMKAMTRHNIGVGVHYLSIPEHSFYREKFGWRPEDFPEAMRAGRQTVSLPLSPKLSADDVEDVARSVRRSLSGA